MTDHHEIFENLELSDDANKSIDRAIAQVVNRPDKATDTLCRFVDEIGKGKDRVALTRIKQQMAMSVQLTMMGYDPIKGTDKWRPLVSDFVRKLLKGICTAVSNI